MFEHRPVDHRKWIGQSSDSLGYTGEVANTAHLQTYKSPIGQQENVAYVDGRPGGKGRTIITVPPLDQRIDAHFMREMKVMAVNAQALILGCDVPGVTNHTHGDFQSPHQLFSAVAGNYEPTGALMLRAIDHVVPFKDGDVVEFRLESLANRYGFGMMEAMAHGSLEKRLHISKVDFIELVHGFGNLAIRDFWRDIKSLRTIEADWLSRYHQENIDMGHGPAEPPSPEKSRLQKRLKGRQAIWSYFAGFGMHTDLTARIIDLMKDHSSDSPFSSDTEVVLSRAVNSTVTHKKELKLMAKAIKEEGRSVRLVSIEPGKGDTTPLGHGVFRSLARLAEHSMKLDSIVT